MIRRICFVVPFLVSSFTLAQSLTDPGLVLNTWVPSGLDSPTGASIFNSRGDMMVIEKNSGRVKVVRDRRVRGTLLDLPVSNDSERGLLGIALSPRFATDNLVYLFHTAAAVDGGAPISNKISRYRYTGSGLEFDRKIIDLPATPGPNHDGGRIVFGPDGMLYSVIGDLNRNNATSNFGGRAVENTAAVIRLTPNGAVPSNNPFTVNGQVSPIYAYGVRNSFGLAFDPVSGDLWNTENGPGNFDEINRVFRGFNSGWEKIMGPSDRNGGVPELVSLGDAAVYDDPKFSWLEPVAPTDLEFMPNSRLGAKYRNTLFVGTLRGGKILNFELTGTRKALRLTGPLADRVADNGDGDLFGEQEAVTFGSDFGIITDIFPGPGGLYVVSLTRNAIYRITTGGDGLRPSALESIVSRTRPAAVPEPGTMFVPGGLFVVALRRRRRSSTGA